MTIVNSIFWDNNAPTGKELAFNSLSKWPIDVSYCDLDGGLDSVYIWGNEPNWGHGMIDTDPLFMEYIGYEYLLDVGSPCIDTGDPAIESILVFSGAWSRTGPGRNLPAG